MSRRTVVLIVVAVLVWGFATYFLFFSPWGMKKPTGRTPKSGVPSPRTTVEVKRVKLTPEVLNEYTSISETGISSPLDLFRPKELGLNQAKLNEILISSDREISDFKFAGYIIENGVGKVFLEIRGGGTAGGKRIVGFRTDEPIARRYLIIHISSLGLVVLDLEKGGMETIR